MRFLKIAIAGLITGLAMLASLVVALGVALIGLVVYLFLRLRGKSAAGRFGTPSQTQPATPAQGDVIDVTATEVGTKQIRS